MKKEVLFLILDQYADWEGALLAASLNSGVSQQSQTKFITRTLAPTLDYVSSLGGFRTLPDYSFENMPDDYAALILIGGLQWQSKEASAVVPIVKRAIEKGRIVGAICNAASFLCAHGFLNEVKHTGNGIKQLEAWGGDKYTNKAGYVARQAVSDSNIVTANGVGYLEFTRELLILLEADSPQTIESLYEFHKNGFIE